MSSISPLPLPQWVASATDSERLSLSVNFHLRLAAAYASPSGDLSTLANLIGETPNSILLSRHRGCCSHDIAIKIEKLLGAEMFPRELFRPEPELDAG
jgi:hypothetical protein